MALTNKKIWIQDIDGCLNNYPNELTEWLNQQTNHNFSSLKEAKSSLGTSKYKVLKFEYRISGMKLKQKILPNAAQTLQYAKSRYDIWVVTSRPPIPEVVSDTTKWLLKNNIPFKELFFKKDKWSFLSRYKDQIRVVVEDSDEHLVFFKAHLPYAKIFHYDHHKLLNSSRYGTLTTDWMQIQKNIHEERYENLI